MYLQRVKNSTLSLFDDKRCYINETESKPWNYGTENYDFQSGVISVIILIQEANSFQSSQIIKFF